MPFTFVRPADPRVLDGRPLLDVGTGDGQTLRALVENHGLVVGIDRSTILRPTVGADAVLLPFGGSVFATVLAADLFHHLDDAALTLTLEELWRVLRPDGLVVAWWYAGEATSAPDAPRYPRTIEPVRDALTSAGFTNVRELGLDVVLGGGPPTVGIVAS